VNETLIETVQTDANGTWSITWTVPFWLEIADHPIEVYAGEQGWYREGMVNSTMRVVHNAGLSLDVSNGGHATRGEMWNITGRLYDEDVAGAPGLAGRVVRLTLDQSETFDVVTDIDGRYQIFIRVDDSASRGAHSLTIDFAGEADWLASSNEATLYVWADVVIEVIDVSENIIRSDSDHPIIITGRVVEVGGAGNVIENMPLRVLWNGEEKVVLTDWDNATGYWTIRFTAHDPMSENEMITIYSDETPSSYLHGDDDTTIAYIMVPAEFSFESLYIDLESRFVESTVRVSAADTGRPLANVSIEARLTNETTTIAQYSRLTGEDGIFTYSFASVKPLPAFSDQAHWGRLSVSFNSTSPLLAADDRARLETATPVVATYAVAEDAAGGPSPPAIAGSLMLLAGLVAALLHLRRRKSAAEALDDTFAYSAELLLAADEIREAIFQCYESLCVTLMEQGFLRRDFETVREFELAIRDALPIREQALIALDQVFEEARYSSHEMGEAHRNAAQQAIDGVRSEIANMAARGEVIPAR
jgi:hypothetical protein